MGSWQPWQARAGFSGCAKASLVPHVAKRYSDYVIIYGKFSRLTNQTGSIAFSPKIVRFCCWNLTSPHLTSHFPFPLPHFSSFTRTPATSSLARRRQKTLLTEHPHTPLIPIVSPPHVVHLFAPYRRSCTGYHLLPCQ